MINELSYAELLVHATKLQSERDALAAEVEGLRDALEAAAKSLNSIATLAGRNEFLDTWENLRGYARNRAYVAEQVIAARTTGGEGHE